MHAKKFTSFYQASKNRHTKENRFLFSASRCTSLQVKKLQKQCSSTLTDDFVINLPLCLCTQQNPVTSAGRTSVDIGASAKLELVDKFCYLGDMLSVD